MKLARAIAWNTSIQFISKILSIILGLITIALMTRYLGQTGFGEYTTINTFLSFFAVAADLGLTLVTVQMISQPNIDRDKTLSNLFSLRFFSALALLLMAPITILFFPYSASIKLGVLITSSCYFFVAMNQIMVGLFQKDLQLGKVALAEIVSRLVLLLGVWLAVVFDWRLMGILWVSVLSCLSSFLVHFYYARRLAHISLNINWQVWLAILKKSWPIGLTIIFNLIYLRADTLLLSIFRSQEEVGIYGASYKIIDVLITLPFIFAGIVLPIMTSAWLGNQKQKFNLIIQKAFDLMAILAVPMVFGAFFLADAIMAVVAGPEFAMAGNVLRLLIIASSTIYLGTVFSHAVIAIDKQKSIIGAYAFVAVTALIGYFIFIPRYSYYGAAAVTIYSELAIALAAFVLVWRHSRFIPSFTTLFKSLLASLAMSLFLYYFKHIPLALSIALGGLIYVITLFLLRGVTREDILEIMNKS
jgi:O-antigen/teichoic acid export membrane protein